ncbi:MAG TPA: undecaprenyl-diphosphate phosphatase [Spirochaetota bacterium]|nr:undecaprenyl-diphosphate phosphatase [Spirochaetota bacterium]HOL56626.1 undecaprenyl-diphosphate phosphatase [Spirochaetota bacterium]HPP03739.1 undecaprenyl-diphosphate phosphatase [Spirochaetota bacterium]
MEYLKAIIIALVQGITEFLPISSSGHILLLKNILNFEIQSNFYDILLHFGTLIAVIFYYRKEIYELIIGIFKNEINSTFLGGTIKRVEILRIWLLFIIATIPAGISGFFLDDFFEENSFFLSKNLFLFLTISFLITGILLFLTLFIRQKKEKDIKSLSFLQSIIIGLFQSIAVAPGISRSGTTISAGIYTGLKRSDAGTFSFLMIIPLISGAFLLKVIKFIKNYQSSDINNVGPFIIGFFVAIITGYISLKLLINVIKNGKFWIFSIYMLLPAIVSFIFWLL